MAQLLNGLGHPLQDQEQHLGTEFQMMFPWSSAVPLHWNSDFTLPHHCTGTCFLLQVHLASVLQGSALGLLLFHFLFYFAG